MEEDVMAAAAKTAANANLAAALAVIAVAVSVAVLAIDNGIKQAIIAEAQKAQKILDQVKKLAGEVPSGAQEDGKSGHPSGADIRSDDGVVHAESAGQVLGQTPLAAVSAESERKARGARRPAGNE